MPPFDAVDPATALAGPEALALAVLLLVVALVVRGRRRRPRPRPRRRTPGTSWGVPRVGEIWFAEVPFDDGTGSKDRPVLVLAVDRRTWEVARFTSQDRSARRDHVRLPPGFPGLTRASWIDLRPRTLPLSAARRRSGDAGEALVAWYREAAGARGPFGRAS
ncbi:type II toxin-antitoxin system PemK/MazF family toxin [Cellulomonas phragmiteti]|uniref:PemK-like, MazF-like toxin of type II toxin-antitoxin system n=1 Tax=Cellulomonas phragmiteti TaxID=478780 RepID=A0ABQ4DR69_9CELL|nr:type II toxin-antitoxin system PemK/MazF family toxin [Cellulomonas phragmiteti]GIG41482.1 hypothetical protein Cph01nite_32440 [Cellulomonas phragmiteti]